MATDISRHTNAMMCLHATLIRGCSTLKTKRIAGHQTKQTNDANNCNASSSSKTYIKIGTGRALRPLITPNDTMLPLWSEFSDALSSLPTQPKAGGVVHLLIAHVQLTDEILEILSSALHKAPLYRLAMMNVGLDSNGIKLLTSVVEENTHLCNFSLRKNEIKDESDTLSLVEAVGNHPGIHICSLDECSIGDQLPTLPGIVNTLFRLEAVGLGGNGIESKGAHIISNVLSTNPSINFLDMDDNLFNDDDALLFATSLKSNTNLVDLSLRGNNFTSVGINTLYRSIFDDDSLSTVSDSNHTCELKLFDDGEPIPAGIDGEVLLMNDKHFEPGELPESARELFMMNADTDKGKAVTSLQVEGRKKMKMLHALVGGTNEGAVNMKYLNDMPIELLPEVLMFFQDASKYAGTEEINFDMVFQLVRSRPEWAWISSVSNHRSKECLPLKG